MFRPASLLALPLALLAAACGSGEKGALEIAIVGTAKAPFESGLRLSVAGQHVHAATTEGLVSLDPSGLVAPALAERWIVTDDGRSYIFRLREGTWADGSDLTAESAQRELRQVVRSLSGTSLGLDLEQVSEIRAMAQRVLEIRLKGPMPEFLQLLAQPELGIPRRREGAGPMGLKDEDGVAVLTLRPPSSLGLPEPEGWESGVRGLRVTGLSFEQAIARFYDGDFDVVLNGRIEALPLVRTGALSRSYIRLDPAIGLFGLMVRRADGFLDSPERREAVAMAIDRSGVMAPFNLGDWAPTTRLVASGLAADNGTIGERWGDMSLAGRWQTASARVAAWQREHGGKPVELTLDLPAGPGSDLLFESLAGDLAGAGITLRRAKQGSQGQLYLLDRVARYADARWFLNQFNCKLRRGVCSADADFLVSEAVTSTDPAERVNLLSEAEAELTRLNAFIPLGQPVRWSLVRAEASGYEPNRWAFHALPPMAVIPR